MNCDYTHEYVWAQFFNLCDTRERLGHAHVSDTQIFILLDIVSPKTKRAKTLLYGFDI